ncbi:hypothetical protein TNCV_3560981 [Trichonephila clavipes]|nr:hypothetical protein TNCV_3560981 [Trichonephila clavipes]
MDRIYICEELTKRNEIDPFLKRMVTGDVKRVTYYNIVRKRLWSKCCEAAQKEAKPGRFYCVFGGTRKESFIRRCFCMAKH